jgi:hypothetical protein
MLHILSRPAAAVRHVHLPVHLPVHIPVHVPVHLPVHLPPPRPVHARREPSYFEGARMSRQMDHL